MVRFCLFLCAITHQNHTKNTRRPPTSTQSHLLFHREGRNEQQIGHVKDVMVSMRRTQSFRETKLRLLHKLAGIEWLSDLFTDDEPSARDWFKGSFRYESWKEILGRYASGQPISCAASVDNDRHFHICYYAKDYETMNYVTVEALPAANFVEVMGVIFCRFEFVAEDGKVKVHTVSNKDFKHQISSHALMLPYKRVGENFQNNFTLVYHDWDVLACNCASMSMKGHPVPARGVWSEEHLDYLTNSV